MGKADIGAIAFWTNAARLSRFCRIRPSLDSSAFMASTVSLILCEREVYSFSRAWRAAGGKQSMIGLITMDGGLYRTNASRACSIAVRSNNIMLLGASRAIESAQFCREQDVVTSSNRRELEFVVERQERQVPVPGGDLTRTGPW